MRIRNMAHPSNDELSSLLARPPQPLVADRRSDVACDSETGKPMVDPVLCNDGKLHDRLSTRALGFLHPEVMLGKPVQVLGEDLATRAMVHERFPHAGRQFEARSAFQKGLPERPPCERGEPPAGRSPLCEDERVFRAYQLRTRRSNLASCLLNPFVPRSQRLPHCLSRHTFARSGALSKAGSRALVQHLARQGVLQGAKRHERCPGDTRRIENALSRFTRRGHPLSREQRAGITQQLRYFDNLYRSGWEVSADLDYADALLASAALVCLQPHPPHTLHGRFVEAYLFFASRKNDVWQRMRPLSRANLQLQTLEACEDARPLFGLTRSQSLPNLSGTSPSPGISEPVLTCPVSLDAMASPTLCNDGHTYELTTLLRGELKLSPMTRQPMRVVGRHAPKQRWFFAENAASADFLRDSRAAMSEAQEGRPRRGGLADTVVSYQRRSRRAGKGVLPDRLSVHIFQAFGVVSTPRDSETLCDALSGQAILFPAATNLSPPVGLFRQVLPTASDAQVREALHPHLYGGRRLDLACKLVSIVRQETLRRLNLVARARHLSHELHRLPAGVPRRREAEELLREVDKALHRLPSGAADNLQHRLY